MRIEPGEGEAPIGPRRTQPRERTCVGGAVSAKHEQARLPPALRDRRRDQVPLARKEVADRPAILRPRIVVHEEAGLDLEIAGISQLGLGEPRPVANLLEHAQLAQLPRRPLHAREVSAQRGRHADDDDRFVHVRIFGHHSPMRIADFALERYFARWEFAVEYLLCASDVEGYAMADLVAMADPEVRALWDGLRLGYTESTGHPLLRTEIANLYDEIEADDVLVFAGAEEAIFCLVNVILGPGDHAVVTWPGYQSLYEIGRAAGADVSLHELREDQRWGLDVERLIAALRPETRLVVVNAPHNPTGMMPTHAEWARLTDALSDRGIHLLSDEVYRFLEFDAADRLLAGADGFPRGISLGVMSKSFAMAGLRIGWLATRDRELLGRCARMKDYTTICSSAPSEILALIGLRERDRVLGRSRRIVADNLDLLDDFFRRRSDAFSWVRPRGGSIGFPRLLADTPIDTFAKDLVEAEGVLLLPGSQFEYPGNHFRIGFGRENLPDALARLDAFAQRALA